MGVGSVKLGEVQETLLSTLYARAAESAKKNGIIHDPKAVEMVESIDYEFTRFAGSPTLFPAVLRTLLLDHWVLRFLADHPSGTVIEIGAGLNSRFERVDNGRVHWVDLDLPDSMELRLRFFAESGRRRMVAASVLDESWIEVAKASPGPYFLVAEGVLLYFTEPDVRKALQLIERGFPGARLAFDTAGRMLVDNQDHPKLKKTLSATFEWACDDPRSVEELSPGVRLLESRSLVQLPQPVRSRLSLAHRLVWPLVRAVYGRRARAFMINLYAVADGGQARRQAP